MLELLFAVVPVAIILVASEVLWRKKIVVGERARKFIHILAGVWIAFWPYYIGFNTITALSISMLIVLVFSRFTHVFHAIYAVKRRTYGDLFYPLGILICSLLTNEAWIFTTAILFVALADGSAAVAGRLWGVKNQYFTFGWSVLRKSIAGTTAYIVLAYVSLFVGWILGGDLFMRDALLFSFAFVPLTATFIESATPYGMDNLITPVFVTLALESLL